MTNKIKVAAIGVVAKSPVFFFDVDYPYSLMNVLAFKSIFKLKGCDVYATKHGYHVVSEVESWDECQKLLDSTKFVFPHADYIRNCRKLRLRLSPKWGENQVEVSPAPVLAICECYGTHQEKRVGTIEGYNTGD